MADDALLEKLRHYLTNEAESISADQIAQEYLKMPPSPITAKLIDSMLSKTPYFDKNKEGLWILKELDSPLISTLSFYSVYVVHSSDNQLLSLAVREIIDEQSELRLTIKNGDIPQNPVDEPQATNFESLGSALAAFTRLTESAPLVFYSYHQQRVLQKYLANYGLSLSDNSSVLSSYFRLANITFSGQQQGINTLAENYLTPQYEAINATEKSALLARLFQFCTEKLATEGIQTVEALLSSEREKIYNTSWPKANFTVKHILTLPETPGVYGFKDEAGSFIYVGKGNNLRRRMLSYFRHSDESPQKLLTLRESAASFITHPCGSDLEALLVENRLIQKYQPKLNTQLQHHLDNSPTLPPMIVLLPSSEEGYLQSLWYGPGAAITLKKLPRSWVDGAPVSTEDLQQFFYASSPQQPSQEKIICSRNLSVKKDDYDRIEINDCESAERVRELLEEACESADGSGSLFR